MSSGSRSHVRVAIVREKLVAVRVVVNKVGVVGAGAGCDWRGLRLVPVAEVGADGDVGMLRQAPRAPEDGRDPVRLAAGHSVSEPGLSALAGRHARDGAEPVDNGADHVRSEEGTVVDAGFVGDGNDVSAEAFGGTRVVTLGEHYFRSRRRRHGDIAVRFGHDLGFARR